MGSNFMEAGTEIQSLISTIKTKRNDIAKLVAKAIVSRAKQGKVNNNIGKDIDNLLADLSTEEKYGIILNVVYYLAEIGNFSNTSGGESKKKKKSDDEDSYDFFGRRGYF